MCLSGRLDIGSHRLTSGVVFCRCAADGRFLYSCRAIDDVPPPSSSLFLLDHSIAPLYWLDKKLLLLRPDHTSLKQRERRECGNLIGQYEYQCVNSDIVLIFCSFRPPHPTSHLACLSLWSPSNPSPPLLP